MGSLKASNLKCTAPACGMNKMKALIKILNQIVSIKCGRSSLVVYTHINAQVAYFRSRSCRFKGNAGGCY